MKKIIFVILIFVFTKGYPQFPGGVFSKDPIINNENFDKQRVYWGYFLGFNSYDFKFEYKNVAPDVLVKTTTGFNVGLVGDLRLFEYGFNVAETFVLESSVFYFTMLMTPRRKEFVPRITP